jgi:hypothetical protein
MTSAHEVEIEDKFLYLVTSDPCRQDRVRFSAAPVSEVIGFPSDASKSEQTE